MKYHGKNLRKGRYSEPGRPYLITSVTHNRIPVFTDLYCTRLVVNEMRKLHDSGVVDSIAWVIMPDHLHWLFTLHVSSLSEVIRQIKGRSACKMNAECHVVRQLWQRGFHDHALRKEEDIKAVARYVIANPLRAGLVSSVGDYPHWDAVWL